MKRTLIACSSNYLRCPIPQRTICPASSSCYEVLSKLVVKEDDRVSFLDQLPPPKKHKKRRYRIKYGIT